MSAPDEVYAKAVKEFHAASDAYHALGRPSTGPVADRYHAAAARARNPIDSRDEVTEIER